MTEPGRSRLVLKEIFLFPAATILLTWLAFSLPSKAALLLAFLSFSCTLGLLAGLIIYKHDGEQ